MGTSLYGGIQYSTFCYAFFARRKRRRRRILHKRRFSGMFTKVVDINRVVKAGRCNRIRFRIIVAVGNKSGIVGLGVAKNQDTRLAILSARFDAKKNFVTIPITGSGTISHLVTGKFGAARLIIKPASFGNGVIAGGSTRSVLQAVGVKNAVSKRFGSNSPLNNAKATILALLKVRRVKKPSMSLKRVFRMKLTIKGYHTRLIQTLFKVEVWDRKSKVVRLENKKELNLVFDRDPIALKEVSKLPSSGRRTDIGRPNKVTSLIYSNKFLGKIGLKTLNMEYDSDSSLKQSGKLKLDGNKKSFRTELYIFSKNQKELQFFVKDFLRKFYRHMVIR